MAHFYHRSGKITEPQQSRYTHSECDWCGDRYDSDEDDTAEVDYAGNKNRSYCPACREEAEAEDRANNSRFGVGA